MFECECVLSLCVCMCVSFRVCVCVRVCMSNDSLLPQKSNYIRLPHYLDWVSKVVGARGAKRGMGKVGKD